MTADWSGGEEPTLYTLPPGTYDLTVADLNAGTQVEVKGLTREAGAEVVKEIAF